jgi:hypothetical protein
MSDDSLASGSLQGLLAEAEALVQDRRLVTALHTLTQDTWSRLRAAQDAEGYLHAHGVATPPGLQVRLLDDPVAAGADAPFAIRLLKCRSLRPPGGGEPTETWVGFEIAPRLTSPPS